MQADGCKEKVRFFAKETPCSCSDKRGPRSLGLWKGSGGTLMQSNAADERHMNKHTDM